MKIRFCQEVLYNFGCRKYFRSRFWENRKWVWGKWM